MAIQKKVNGTWQSINPKQLRGVPYTGTLPAVLTGTKAGYLHKYKIYGNLSQNGTPTPENPIYPSECGERTENLYDYTTDEQYKYINQNGEIITLNPIAANAVNFVSAKIPVVSGHTYILFKPILITSSGLYTAFYDSNDNVLWTLNIGRFNETITLEAPENASYLRTSLKRDGVKNTTTMLTEGSTAPTSYIPYGYKLPLLSGSTPVDIYIGESQTTRRIKKLVLTGTENWGYNDSNHTAYLTTPDSFLGEGVSVISTHYTAVSNKTAYSQLSDKQCCLRENGNYVWVRDNDYSTVEDFKTYLRQQYANGTPVTVWYVLATEETGTLNEPLRKIGNYADTIDSTQTSAQIPTTANSTTIRWAGQGLAPSEFDSIQEWVDIPTYKRVNGEWVADN